MTIALPPDIYDKWGGLPFLEHRSGMEWSAACPRCGDSGHDSGDKPDRFRIFVDNGHSRGWCRKCGYFSWADSKKEETIHQVTHIAKVDNQGYTPPNLEEDKRWLTHWSSMTEFARGEWRRAGITDDEQDRLYLGWLSSYPIFSPDGQSLNTPALSIPYFWYGYKPITIQYRLMKDIKGRYRFIKGLPHPLYLTEPSKHVEGRVLLVEGAKKAIVTNSAIGDEFDCVAGVYCKTPTDDILDQLGGAETVYIGLDPDAVWGGQSSQIAKKLLARNVSTRIVVFPDKPDDIIISGGSAADLMACIRQARTVTK